MVRHKPTTESVPKRGQVIELVRARGLLRPSELEQFGISGEYLNKLHRQGVLDRVDRGLYRITDAVVVRHSQLAEVAKRVPHGVVCLLSALDFHELTTALPHQVWLAIPTKARAPRFEIPPLKIVRCSAASLQFGVEVHRIDGVDVKVFSPAKTVADCYKFRSKVGHDIAMEALRETWRQRRASIDQLWQAAQVCRMTNVMRPYLESLV